MKVRRAIIVGTRTVPNYCSATAAFAGRAFGFAALQLLEVNRQGRLVRFTLFSLS